MNAPGSITRSQPMSSSLSSGMIAAIVVGGIVATLLCGGIAAATMLWAITRAPAVLEQANLPVPSFVPPSMAPATANDWWTDRVLAEVYTTALDAVVADEQVIERLGEDVGVDIEAEELYRRERTGALDKNETIEFEIAGTKGRATVKAAVTGSEGMELKQNLEFSQITVTLSDGSIIDVPPPSMQSMQIR